MSQSASMDTLQVARDARLEGRLEQEAEILATVEVEFEHRRALAWESSSVAARGATMTIAGMIDAITAQRIRSPERDAILLNPDRLRAIQDINRRIDELQRQQAMDTPCWIDEPQSPAERYGEIGGSLLGPRRVVHNPSMRLGRVGQ